MSTYQDRDVQIDSVTLEMSLKPFRDPSPPAVETVCRHLFRQWLPLCRHARSISVMLWSSDGSEILDYQGDLDAPFEWARYLGGANARPQDGQAPGIDLHSRTYLYCENPPVLTYRWQKELVATLKRVGGEVTGKPIRVGATFDPGPEFAESSFKYKRHREICVAPAMGHEPFVCCYGVLKGDTHRYAGFPQGIPDGTPFGKFLGRQCRHYLADLGFDYIWFSNGFGFGSETWGALGEVFDGKVFHTERCAELGRRGLDFWKLFREECPGFGIETRGTNLGTGMDLASDAVPLKAIYEGGFDLEPPPNSPWAAINGDFGVELVGWMSHFAEHPPGRMAPFRFYTHDPWWINSPWLDRYGREPHDIYLPLSASRVTEDGTVETPSRVEFLTADDSYGRLPDQVPVEVIPHVLKGLADRPDAPGPVVWLYPFDEYHRYTFEQPERIGEVFFGDWFMRDAVNAGFPLNTVLSTRGFPAAVRKVPERLAGSVLVTPVPDAGSEVEKELRAFVARGGRALLYGPLTHASAVLRGELETTLDAPLDGDFEVETRGEIDRLAGRRPAKLRHGALYSAGGLRERAGAGTDVLAVARRGGDERAIALLKRVAEGGAWAWVRGTLSCDPSKLRRGNRLVTPFPPEETLRAERLMRLALATLGVTVGFRHDEVGQKLPLTCIHRHANGFVFSGHVPEQQVDVELRLPYGAPLLQNVQARLVNGRAQYRLPKAWHTDCRVFVEQDAESLATCYDQPPVMVNIQWRYRMTGLKNATVRFFPPTGCEKTTRMMRDPHYPFHKGEWTEPRPYRTPAGPCLEVTGVTGDLMICW